MSDEEKRETEGKKREGSKGGQQHVANTEKAKQARKGSQAPPLKNYDDLSVVDVENKVQGLSKEEVRDLLDYEKRHENRKTLVGSLSRKV
jgi:CRISPR/Cas system CSM-associated protein Csm2 small subunit